MNIKYYRWIEGELVRSTMIDPDYQSPEETMRKLKLKFSDIEKIEIQGTVYKNEVNGLEQVELMKRLMGK